MKNTAKLLAAIVLLNLLITSSYGADTFAKKSNPDLQIQGEVEKVLNHYLECRRKGDFKCCSDSLTSSYLKIFSERNKMPYIDFYKSTEIHYHDAKLTRFNKVSANLIDVTVESYSEEPGFLSRDIESYRFKSDGGSWKIDDISTNETKVVKEIGADGKWKDVNK